MLIILGPATFIKDLPFLWYSGQAWTGAFFGGYAGVLIIKGLHHIVTLQEISSLLSCRLPRLSDGWENC